MRRLYPTILPLLVVIALDQLTKWWALETFWRAEHAPTYMEIVPGWLVFTPVENRGVAFGMFRNHGLLLALLVVVILIVVAIRNWQEFLRAPAVLKGLIGIIIGGGAGNLIDRARLQFVVDFITIPALPIFQVFNIADMAITVGGTLLVFVFWRMEQASQRSANELRQQPAEVEEAQKLEAEKR